MATTIKAARGLRDVLTKQTRAHGRTLDEHLASLAETEERHERLAAMHAAMAANPPDDAYRDEARSCRTCLGREPWTRSRARPGLVLR